MRLVISQDNYLKLGVKSRPILINLHRNIEYASKDKFGSITAFLDTFNSKWGYNIKLVFFSRCASPNTDVADGSIMKLSNMCDMLGIDYFEAQKRFLYEGLPEPQVKKRSKEELKVVRKRLAGR